MKAQTRIMPMPMPDMNMLLNISEVGVLSAGRMPSLARKRSPAVNGAPGATAISLKLRCPLMVMEGISMTPIDRPSMRHNAVSIDPGFVTELAGGGGG